MKCSNARIESKAQKPETRDEQIPGICTNRKKNANGRLADWSFGAIRIVKIQTFGNETNEKQKTSAETWKGHTKMKPQGEI